MTKQVIPMILNGEGRLRADQARGQAEEIVTMNRAGWARTFILCPARGLV
jgi:hypothetical protein